MFPRSCSKCLRTWSKKICCHMAIGGHHDPITHAHGALLALAYVRIERLWDQMALAERLILQTELAFSVVHALSTHFLCGLWRYSMIKETPVETNLFE